LGFSADSIRRELDRILSSRTFRSAAAQRNFLRYAVIEELQGRGHLLKEYAIGVAVFSKGESFDPRLDSIVRSEARKLRARLARYFESEGRADPLRIHLPLGRYVPVITERSGFEPAVSKSPSGRNLRLAVLPFACRSANRRDESFSDGLTDELTHAFTRIPGLDVVSRTSAFQFKGQRIDVREIGRRLNVHAVIEGSVKVLRHRIRVIAQLADTLNGHALWSGSYDRKLTDLFAVQQELSSTVTHELGVHFRRRPFLLGAADGPVQEEYLRGRSLAGRYTLEDYEAAIDCFEQAIVNEAASAGAYAGLAHCYVMLPFFKAMLQSELIPKIRAAASKALELDASLGEAHIVSAVPLIYDFNWFAAGEGFRRGLELRPSDPAGRAWYGTYLLNIGRGEEGLLEHKRVWELDPASPLAAHNYGLALYFLRRHEEAIRQFRKALALNASHAASHAGLGMACVHKGSYARGVTELEIAEKLTPGLGRVTADLGYAYAVSGNREKANEILNRFLRQFDPASFPAVMIAGIYIGLGDSDRAFEWLHKAIDQKDLAVFLKSDPLYGPLRKDPRFSTLLRRTNLL
jgi:TolB-like protein/Flp pilus assembly protein TadD